MTVDYSGKNTSAIHTPSLPDRVLFGLAVSNDGIYVSSWHPGSVKFVGVDSAQVKEVFNDEIVTNEVFSLAVPSQGSSPAGRRWFVIPPAVNVRHASVITHHGKTISDR